MRRIGKITSYGNYNTKTKTYNNYGNISEFGEVIFFHKKTLKSDNVVWVGSWVTYELGSFDGRPCAENIIVIDEELDLTLFNEFFVNADWNQIVQDVSPRTLLVKYLLHIKLPDAERLILTKKYGFTNDNWKTFVKVLVKCSFPSIKLMKRFLGDSSFLDYLISNHELLENLDRRIYYDNLSFLMQRFEFENRWNDLLKYNLIYERSIFEIAPCDYKIKALIKKKDDNAFCELAEIINNSLYKNNLIDLLPTRIKRNPVIFELLPPKEKLKVLCSDNNDIPYEQFDEIAECFYLLSESEKAYAAAEIIPKAFQISQYFYPYVPVGRQLIVLSQFEGSDFVSYWELSKRQTKIYHVFRCCMKGEHIPEGLEKKDQVVSSLITMLNSNNNTDEKRRLFNTFHKNLQDEILTIAFDLNTVFNYSPMFPQCPNEIVEYCEGKKWSSKKNVAYCPRINNACLLGSSVTFEEYFIKTGARINPNLDLNLKDWCLLEFFKGLNITPCLHDLANPEEYVNRMSGWINRLIEIRERLRCSTCGKALISNKKYSKDKAAYNATIFSCEIGIGHDMNIYLNHCWACYKLIDSRESRFQDDDGYYICIHCGSGSRKRPYMQGTICPACGHKEMELLEGRKYKCLSCHHIIKIPPRRE